MTHKIRVVELASKEVYIDVNDLIIELLLCADSAPSDAEAKVYKSLVVRLTAMRDKAHGHGVNHEQDRRF